MLAWGGGGWGCLGLIAWIDYTLPLSKGLKVVLRKTGVSSLIPYVHFSIPSMLLGDPENSHYLLALESACSAFTDLFVKAHDLGLYSSFTTL